MKRAVVILAFLLVVMIGGSVLTAGVWDGLPTMEQTADPLGSYFQAPPGQAAFFFGVVGFILFNLIGMGATIALLVWLGSREVKVAETIPTRAERDAADAEALPETATT